MQPKTLTIEVLYGQSLCAIVTQALNSLESKSQEEVLIKDILREILLKRPYIIEHVGNSKDKIKVVQRITNCVRKMHKTGLLDLEVKQTEKIDYTYIVVNPKLN